MNNRRLVDSSLGEGENTGLWATDSWSGEPELWATDLWVGEPELLAGEPGRVPRNPINHVRYLDEESNGQSPETGRREHLDIKTSYRRGTHGTTKT